MNLDFTGVEQTILLLIAGGLAIGIIVGIAGTPLYPVAYAMVLVALIWVFVNNESVLTEITDFINMMLGAKT
jgi:hypothetical protein